MIEKKLETSLERYNKILERVSLSAKKAGRDPASVRVVAVTKTFEQADIRPIITAGHRSFGENRVQEARSKWPFFRALYDDLDLHLIGPLQSNKVKDAVMLFDNIHSIDRSKIAEAVALELLKQPRKIKFFVQVNTGEEPQKSGVLPRDVKSFIKVCRENYKLDVFGLMCIPPHNLNPTSHFEMLSRLANENSVMHLSMGMSEDFEIAIACGATHIRVGSAIFGTRE